VQVEGLDGIKQVAAAGYYTLALGEDGTVWSWGDNSSGQLGDGTKSGKVKPAPVLGAAKQIAAGSDHALAVMIDGTVTAWGGNGQGQLGDGTMTDRLHPAKVPGLQGISNIAAGMFYSFAATGDGQLWGWGANRLGQLGAGHTADRFSPERIGGLDGVRSIGAGFYNGGAVSDRGVVYTWGSNAGGQLGNGTEQSVTAPVKVLAISPEAADSENPTAPVEISLVGVSKSMAQLSWQGASDDAGIAAYEIYVDGELAGTSGLPEYVLRGLQSGASYTVEIQSRDTSGKLSQRASIQLTTL